MTPAPALLVLLAFLWLALPAQASEEQPCRAHPNDVVVDTTSRTLFLCRKGEVDARYPVNLGGGGLGKRKQGDRKTPLGRYPLSRPRESYSGFTWFVPIGYPTAAQKKRGYTGGAIGIHGPPDWLPQLVVDAAFDTPWTDGCIMVRTKPEIDAIREWLLEHEPRWVHIVPESTPARQTD